MLGFVTLEIELKSKSLPSRSSQSREDIGTPTIMIHYADCYWVGTQNRLVALVRPQGESEQDRTRKVLSGCLLKDGWKFDCRINIWRAP